MMDIQIPGPDVFCRCETGNCTCRMPYVPEKSENSDYESRPNLGVSQIVVPDGSKASPNEFSPGGNRRTLKHTNEFTSAINETKNYETYPQIISITHGVEDEKAPEANTNNSCSPSTSHQVSPMEDIPPPLPLSKPPSSSLNSPSICDSGGETTLSREKVNQDKMISGLGQFFLENESQESEIEKILADFNEILNSDDPYAFSTPGNEEFVTNAVEAFSDLLIGGDSDLLIVVDECDQSDSLDGAKGINPETTEGEECFEEGYESDLPMVRKSMRKLRPVHMPVSNASAPSTSSAGASPSTSSFPIHPFYQPTTVRPSTSGILHVTSLVNNLNVGGGTQTDQSRDNVVLDIETSSQPTRPVATTQVSSEQVTRSASSHTFPTTEGCATFRPSTDLVFANLHIVPPDLTEALAETSDNGDGRTPTPSGTSGNASRLRRRASHSNNNNSIPANSRSAGRWPHRLSSVLALIGCSLGLTNICRFGSLSIQYGANFTLQFSLLSLVFGIPFFLFHMSIGQYLASGIVDMWKISPIFQGIGIGLVISQAMIGIYTSVGVSWMFIYFRDSFIPRYDQYRWGKCFRDYRGCDQNLFNNTQLSETVPDYFNGVVLQRSSPEFPSSAYIPSSLKFTVAFNLAVVWMLVFVSLSKGLKSYGKVIHGFILIPITALLVLTSKMVGLVPSEDAGLLFGPTSWEDFFFNTQTWVIAAREAFFTWGLFGACVMQITAHNRPSHSLKSDATIVVLITTFILLLTSFLGNACHYVLQVHGYEYVPSSFESELSFRFLAPKKYDMAQPSIPAHLMNQHTSFLMGVRITKSEMAEMFEGGNSPKLNMVSGYQALRLATELFPATMALLGSQGFSPFWTVLFYFTFILFGLAQQLAIWYTVIKGVIAIRPKILRTWESTISFSICAVGFVLGLPLCTEFGIFVVYFLDYCIGSGWWIMVLYLLELVAVFIVRGAPYCGENIVTVLFSGGSKLSAIMAPTCSFVWNVILPVAVLILSISSFKNGNVRELYDWTPTQGYVFWPNWTRELGSLIQLLPLLTVPFVAIIQSCRYLSTGPPNLLDRIQLLYRPHSRGIVNGSRFPQAGRSTTNFPSRTNSQLRVNEDPPPKYTPPPSYSAVTGAKIAKFLRNSIRRSIRRISGASPSHSSTENLPPPPYYSSVILEMNSEEAGTSSSCRVENSKGLSLVPILISPPPEDVARDEDSGRRRFEINITQNSQSRPSTLGRLRTDNSLLNNNDDNSAEKVSLRRIASDITPMEVARILRASFRRDESPVANNHPPVGIAYSNPNPSSTYQSHHDDSIDSMSIINQDTASSTGSNNTMPRNHNFDFTSRSSRNRRSNDSQLGLLANQHSPGISTSSENLHYFGLTSLNSMSLGIANPSFQSSVLGVSSTPTSPRATGAGAAADAGHMRTNSLTVPLSSTNSHYHHRTN